MRKIFILLSCFPFISATANNSSNEQATAVGETAVAVIDFVSEAPSDSLAELPLPVVPTSLQTLNERANYIITHFWDAMDFNDTHRSCNTAFMEQNFSNFISVFPYADETARTTATETLMRKAATNGKAYDTLADIAEKYLYNLDSPMHSEDYYILFLKQMLNLPMKADDPRSARLQFRWDAVNKNRPGMTAANFDYTTRNGIATTLHSTSATSHILLIFYDPDCDHCKDVMNELQSNQPLSSAAAAGKLQILAIYSGDDHDLWTRTASSLPQNWLVGYDPGTLQENGSYIIRTLPTLYLLDANKQVLQKETSITSVLSAIGGNQ